jgi:uncharacterized protein YdeI (YjbR/CyaY-like superfamily)
MGTRKETGTAAGANQRYFKDRKSWRTWLRKNHAKADVLWLVCYKKHTGKTCIEYEAAVEEALCYGWIDSIVKRLDDDRYLRKFTPRTNTHKWSPSNLKRMKRLIASKRMTKVGLAKYDPVTKTQETAPSRSLNTPKYFSDALAGNATAARFFEQLTPSHRRNMVGWVASAKREQTRLKRLKEVISLLEQKKKLGLK